MSSEDAGPVSVLSLERCWELIAEQEIGRLGTCVDRVPDIAPVNFVVDDQTIVFRTAEGSKLFALTINDNVAFEVDGWNTTGGWSVVLHGTAAQITEYEDVMAAEALPLQPWVPTVKLHYVRITPEALTGRLFRFGPEPERNYAEP